MGATAEIFVYQRLDWLLSAHCLLLAKRGCLLEVLDTCLVILDSCKIEYL